MNQTAIFEVLSNLKYGDELHLKGECFEGSLEKYGYLVNDGVLRIVEGATSPTEAETIVEADKVQKEAEVEATKPADPQNTWGPKPDVDPTFAEPTVPVVEATPTTEVVPETTTPAPTTEATPEETGVNL